MKIPWEGHPGEKHIERLILALNTAPAVRKAPAGWVPGHSKRKLLGWKASIGLRGSIDKPFVLAVKMMDRDYEWAQGAHKKDMSRYFAIVHEWMMNFDTMLYYTGLTVRQRCALRKLARDNDDICHTLAVAQLYCTATRCLGKEVDNEHQATA